MAWVADQENGDAMLNDILDGRSNNSFNASGFSVDVIRNVGCCSEILPAALIRALGCCWILMDEKENSFNFDRCVEMIRSRDALTYEAGYHSLVDKVSMYVDELITLMKAEPDPFTRGKFVELLGETKSPLVFEALAKELNHNDNQVREWAVSGLLKLNIAEADELVRKYKEEHPEEAA